MAKDKWSDSEFALEAVRRDGVVLEYADESFQADRTMVLEDVGHRGQGHKIPNMAMYFAVLMSYEGHIAS